ncbi:MAG: hypothetical protein ACRDC6_16335, partial [Shewanella sp.]
MSLSEGKMFTIEALNRIDGFVWPEGCGGAFLNKDNTFVRFVSDCRSVVLYVHDGAVYSGYYSRGFTESYKHKNWRNSLITREEFESVDGWVNINGQAAASMEDLIDVMLDGGLIVSGVTYSDALLRHQPFSKWRYSKPQKQEVKPEPESNSSAQPESQDGIESLISKRKAVKEIARLARIELEQAEAAEQSLMLSIEAWAESHGFDIRVLSESEEKPELVITDFGDLRIGDEIECIN